MSSPIGSSPVPHIPNLGQPSTLVAQLCCQAGKALQTLLSQLSTPQEIPVNIDAVNSTINNFKGMMSTINTYATGQGGGNPSDVALCTSLQNQVNTLFGQTYQGTFGSFTIQQALNQNDSPGCPWESLFDMNTILSSNQQGMSANITAVINQFAKA